MSVLGIIFITFSYISMENFSKNHPNMIDHEKYPSGHLSDIEVII